MVEEIVKEICGACGRSSRHGAKRIKREMEVDMKAPKKAPSLRPRPETGGVTPGAGPEVKPRLELDPPYYQVVRRRHKSETWWYRGVEAASRG